MAVTVPRVPKAGLAPQNTFPIPVSLGKAEVSTGKTLGWAGFCHLPVPVPQLVTFVERREVGDSSATLGHQIGPLDPCSHLAQHKGDRDGFNSQLAPTGSSALPTRSPPGATTAIPYRECCRHPAASQDPGDPSKPQEMGNTREVTWENWSLTIAMVTPSTGH